MLSSTLYSDSDTCIAVCQQKISNSNEIEYNKKNKSFLYT